MCATGAIAVGLEAAGGLLGPVVVGLEDKVKGRFGLKSLWPGCWADGERVYGAF